MWRVNDLTSGYAALFSVIEELVCKQQNVTQKMLTLAMLLVSLKIAKHILYTPALKLLVTTFSEVYDFRERTGLNKVSSRELVPYLQIRYAEYCSDTRNAVQAEEAVEASCSSNASEVLCDDIFINTAYNVFVMLTDNILFVVCDIVVITGMYHNNK